LRTASLIGRETPNSSDQGNVGQPRGNPFTVGLYGYRACISQQL